MSIDQALLDARVAAIVSEHQIDRDAAFLRLAYSLLSGQSWSELEEEDIVDGSQDKGLDVVTITENGDSASILIIQSKNTGSFESTSLVRMANGFGWLFERPEAEFRQITNTRLVAKMREIRSLYEHMVPANIVVRAVLATKGDSNKLAQEFTQELRKLREEYSGTFGQFDVDVFGARELVERLNAAERKERQVSGKLQIDYDRNRASLIEYQTGGVQAIICSVPGVEIARLVGEDKDGALFDRNLRHYLGEKGSVNTSILNTSRNPDESQYFWFFNNGVTIVCDDAKLNVRARVPYIELTNIQIVNGCQTSVSLGRAYREGHLRSDVNVLVKIFKTSDAKFSGNIVFTTNNQNAINTRDLKANDPVQEKYERAWFELYGLRYERKVNQYKDLPSSDQKRVVSNERIAQAYMAIVLKRPTTARTQKYRIWSDEFYDQVFPDGAIDRHVLAHYIYDYAQKRKLRALKQYARDEVRYSIASYGVDSVSGLL